MPYGTRRSPRTQANITNMSLNITVNEGEFTLLIYIRDLLQCDTNGSETQFRVSFQSGMDGAQAHRTQYRKEEA